MSFLFYFSVWKDYKPSILGHWVLHPSPNSDVTKMGESLVLPPEVYPLYHEKEFIPADTEDSGIPNVSEINGLDVH